MGERRVAIVGGGIVGLALGRALATEWGGEVVLYEKEGALAPHQSSHNSGVVHAGLYYAPGSLKARLCREGGAMLREYCAEKAIPFSELGKLVVARDEGELAGLEAIRARAVENQVPDLAVLGSAEIAGIEPHVVGARALHSPHTAVIDFPTVARAYGADLVAHGGEVRLGDEVRGLREVAGGVLVRSDRGEERFAAVVCCAGAHSDRFARLAGATGGLHVVPFRGEYHRLAPSAAALVRGLVYPVPDPRYPFLGVHLTRTLSGEVLAGPNAVFATALEGYRRRDLSVRELAGVLAFSGTRRLFAAHWRAGLAELGTSLSRRAYAAKVRAYLPALSTEDLQRAPAGVRAQLLDRAGALVDDFVIETSGRVTVVRNAPSPAATSSLAIAAHLHAELERKGQLDAA